MSVLTPQSLQVARNLIGKQRMSPGKVLMSADLYLEAANLMCWRKTEDYYDQEVLVRDGVCNHCKQPHSEHVNHKCVFGATMYAGLAAPYTSTTITVDFNE